METKTQKSIVEEKIEEKKILTLKEKIKAVNALLLKGEPRNVSQDTYSGYTGYKPQAIIDCMNQVFDIGEWGFDEVSTEVIKDEANKPSLAICQVRIWFIDTSDKYAQIGETKIAFQPVAWGQSKVTRGDIGDGKKGAQTDAIKKALSYFSIGNRAFWGLLEKK